LRDEGHFHHWRDPPTERTTAFLCYECHKKHGHEHRRKTVRTLGIPIDEETVLVRKPIKITSEKAKPKRKAPKKRGKKKITKTPLERYAKEVDKIVYGVEYRER